MSPAPAGPLSLAGKVAVVAGAGGGIGTAIASALGAAGAAVCGLDLAGRPPPAGTQGIACDLRDSAAVDAAVARVAAEHGGVDLCVHSAGVTRDRVLWKLGDEDWTEVLRVNLDSAFYLLRAVAPRLREREGGSVVLVSSINGERGKRGQANYAASKAGLIGLGRTAARELGRFGVRVNVVAPGLVRTPMTAGLPAAVLERAVEESVLGRAAEPADVAGVVLFLCSELSRHVTGQVLRVDGGQCIG